MNQADCESEAVAYASTRGWLVFPAPPGQKKSYKSAEYSGGRKWGATKDPEEIKRDFARWPGANVGVVTGSESGIFVVEADTKEGHDVDGIASLKQLEADRGPLPLTLMAKSPSGSLHYYFNWPGKKVKNSSSELALGVDVRGDGGMVIAPPSVREDGTYIWLNDSHVVDAPQWLIDLVTKDQRSELPRLPESLRALLVVQLDEMGFFEGRRHDISTDPADIPEPIDLTKIRAAVEVIPNADLGWEDWNKKGMAIYRATDGKGFEIFDSWSQKSKKYDSAETVEKWYQYSKYPPTEIGVGTIFYEADKADPGWRSRHDAKHDDNKAKGGIPEIYFHGESTDKAKINWAIKKLMYETGVGLLSGQWGTLKTFVALEIAGSLMPDVNEEFFIDYRIKRKGGVLFVAAEGASSVELRFNTMLAEKLGLTMDQDAPKQPFAWINLQPEVLKKGAKELIDRAKQAAAGLKEKFGVELVLIVIDTVAAAAAFQREDDAAQGQTVLNAFRELSTATGSFVLGVDHFGKDIETGTRGSSAKEGAADVVLALVGKREVTGRMTDLRMGVRKVRDADVGRVIPFRAETVNLGVDEDGDQITSCVIHWEPNRKVGQLGRPEKGHDLILEAIRLTLIRESKSKFIEVDGLRVHAAPRTSVLGKFKELVKEEKGKEIADEAIKKRWQRDLKKAVDGLVVRDTTVDGQEYLSEIAPKAF